MLNFDDERSQRRKTIIILTRNSLDWQFCAAVYVGRDDPGLHNVCPSQRRFWCKLSDGYGVSTGSQNAKLLAHHQVSIETQEPDVARVMKNARENQDFTSKVKNMMMKSMDSATVSPPSTQKFIVFKKSITVLIFPHAPSHILSHLVSSLIFHTLYFTCLFRSLSPSEHWSVDCVSR